MDNGFMYIVGNKAVVESLIKREMVTEKVQAVPTLIRRVSAYSEDSPCRNCRMRKYEHEQAVLEGKTTEPFRCTLADAVDPCLDLCLSTFPTELLQTVRIYWSSSVPSLVIGAHHCGRLPPEIPNPLQGLSDGLHYALYDVYTNTFQSCWNDILSIANTTYSGFSLDEFEVGIHASLKRMWGRLAENQDFRSSTPWFTSSTKPLDIPLFQMLCDAAYDLHHHISTTPNVYGDIFIIGTPLELSFIPDILTPMSLWGLRDRIIEQSDIYTDTACKRCVVSLH